ncbi:SMI1/KNR4 family protein [Amycolatopsis sp. Poz14]|uniref:SMI1/KNR4 family protein n=1 Tax=Amycolatopsis sp. Poz14 TaxID=1447705 RepID=UPI001EE7AABC|nr:SMI1/KNR4 family protein [Amycolatopsis sp. Poz14]MCG3757042.1 SMI1/KNR4 family protein [Amycolatopsis sp. Poz14]
MDLGEIGRTLAERLRGWAGDGWSEAVLQISTGSEGSVEAWTDGPDHTSGRDLLPAMYGAYPPDHPPAAYEVRLRSDGTYRCTTSPDVDRLSPARRVFDPDFRCPRRPAAGMPRPAGTEPTGAPTDPAVLSEVRALVEEFAERYTAITGHAPDWEPGRSEEEIAAVEARIQVRLPEDLRALHRLIGRDSGETGLLGYYAHDSLETVVEDYLFSLPGAYRGAAWDEPQHSAGVVFEATPPGRIKRVSRNDWWVSFGGNHSDQWIAVDLDPAEGGRSGQVIEHGEEVAQLLAPSVAAMIADVVAALRAGRFTRREGDPRLEIQAAFHDFPYENHVLLIRDVAKTDLAAELGTANREAVQSCHLTDGAHLDLAALEPLGGLRELGAHRMRSVVPAVTNLPLLESLTIAAEQTDLKALAGHPTLWDLTLSDLTHPVDLTPLATLPNLTRLAISGLDIPAIDQLAQLPALRVLTLDADQLTRLLASGHRIPQLAALTISGRVLLSDAVEFLRHFRDTDVRLKEFTGSLSAPPEQAQA